MLGPSYLPSTYIYIYICIYTTFAGWGVLLKCVRIQGSFLDSGCLGISSFPSYKDLFALERLKPQCSEYELQTLDLNPSRSKRRKATYTNLIRPIDRVRPPIQGVAVEVFRLSDHIAEHLDKKREMKEQLSFQLKPSPPNMDIYSTIGK